MSNLMIKKLPETLHKELKIYCIKNNVTIQKTIISLIKEGLKLQETKSLEHSRLKDGAK